MYFLTEGMEVFGLGAGKRAGPEAWVPSRRF